MSNRRSQQLRVQRLQAATRRIGGYGVGLAAQVMFAYTVWRMCWFLKDGAPPSSDASLAWDATLALQFAVPHSLLLLPAVRKRLSARIGAPFYGAFFCIATCVGMLTTIAWWETSDLVLWQLEGWAAWSAWGAFALSWAALYYSIRLTGLGYQTGYTPWLHWVRGTPVPRRGFEPRGAYHWLRHPIYLSFLGLIWFTPRMTIDHALLTGMWTVYIFVGSWLKDRRLAYYLGDEYREYAARVPGYPGMLRGPWGRLPAAPAPAGRVANAA